MARHDSSDEDIKDRSRDRRERERSVDMVDASDEEHRRRRRNRQERERSDRDRPGSNEDEKGELKRDNKDRSRDRRERERSMDMVDSSDEEEDRRLRRNRRERADKDRRGSNEDEKGELKRENKEEDASANGDGKRREREKGHRDLSSDEEDDRANPRRDRGGKDRTRGDGGASDEEDERANPRRDRGGKDRTRGDRGRSDEDDDTANRQRDRGGKDRTCRDRGASDEDDDEANLERDRRGKDRTRRDRGASDEDDDRANPRRDRRDKDRTFGDRGAFDEEEEGEISRREKDTALTEEDREGRLKRDRRDRERGDRHENGYRQRREDDDGYRRKDRHSRRDSESGDRVHKHRDRYIDVRKDKERKEREVGDRGSRKKEERDGTRMEEPKPQKQPAVQEDNALAGSKSGGVYIPPFKLARMMKEVQDKSSVEYQRLTWDALRKSINGLVNKVNASNLKNIIPELFAENLIRGRGLFCRSCMKSQMASPGFTDVFAALVAVVNTKFPEVGDLLLRRIVLQLKRAYKRNDKPQLLAAVKFIAHLVNQQVAHEIIALELLTVLLENPTDDSVEVAVGFVTECGSILQELSPKGLHGIFERFRGILHEGEIDKRVQFLIEGLFAVRKAKFQGHPAVRPELDLVEPEDQLTHEISLQEEIEPEIALDIFRPDSQFVENEKKYEELKKSIIGEESEDDDVSDAGSSDEDDEEEESDEEDEEQMKIQDETETNLVNLRRTIYLTIMSSVDFEEAGHKLLKIKLEPGQEMELCIMLLECCSQERTYLRYYGLLGQRFCMINKIHQENFEKSFVQQYSMIHRLETNKLRNVAKFFAHLLGTDALPWHVLAYIRLTEEDTTSSSRIFIKILFQELSEQLGIKLLNERLQDPTMQDSFDSIFPKDNPKNTRFAINFFTSIGLGGITESLREYLKNMPRLIMQQQKQVSESESESESDTDSASSSGTSDSSDSDTDSASSDSDESERDKRKRRRRN